MGDDDEAVARFAALVQEKADTLDRETSDALRRFIGADASVFQRYLRARDGNEKKAFEALVKTARWRSAFGADDIDVHVLRETMKSGKMYVSHGRDRQGRPIIMNIKNKERESDHNIALKMIVYNMQKAIRCMRSDSDGKWIWILHLGEYTRASSPPLAVTKETLNIFANHMPERLHRAYLFQAPTVFRGLYRIVKPFLDNVTREKIIFVNGVEDEKGMQKLLEDVHPDQLESVVGGNLQFSYDFDREELGESCS